MTIETPQASRPLHQPTMFANSPSVFHDYAASPITSDHSLQTDLRFPSSPNSLTMYDGDAEFMPSSLGSMCSDASFVDTGQQSEEFDLKPQFECTDNAFLHQCLEIPADGGSRDDTLVVRSDPAWSPSEASLMKMEDIFQVDQKDAIQGPTLAELNFDDSLSVYDEVVEKDEHQKRLVSGGCTLWQQAIQSGMDTTYNAPQVVFGGQKAPIKFTTCTVTSPTATAIDMRIGAPAVENKPVSASSLSTLPQALYSVTAKLSLFSEPAPVIKQEQGMDSSLTNTASANCLKVPQPSGLSLLAGHGMVVPPPQPAPAPAAATKLSAENSMLPMAMETEETKSSLQRLLSDPLPVVIKTEPVDIPMAASMPANTMWTPRTPVSTAPHMQTSSSAPTTGMMSSPMALKSVKRARSPEIEPNMNTSSMEQKWEEIKQFIYDEEQTRDEELAARLQQMRQRQQQQQQQQQMSQQQPQQQSQQQQQEQQQQPQASEEEPVALTPPKRVKTEPKDPAFTVKDEVDSADEDIDSDQEDTDDGGDSVIGRDMDDHSDAESDNQFLLMDDGASSTKGPPRYFWMYNTQSKGPKGKRLCKAVSTVDPYTLNDFEDPVFDPVLNQTQYKHNGKARRGDGNDITPSPQKLYALGNELKKLNRIITDLTPVSELPAGARSKSRKEKNKLASRACRLKKKAQHEANKVKLYGLEREHHDLLTVLSEIRDKVFKMVKNPELAKDESLSPTLERLMKVHLTHMIAGHTADYVNSVLAKVMGGDPSGGLAL